MGLAVLSLFFKRQAFWYSFIERLYELSQKYCWGFDTTATPEYSKAFMMQKSKSYIRLLDGMLPKYTGKTEPVKWVRIHNLPSFVYYFTHSKHVNVANVKHVTGRFKNMKFKKHLL
jgi:hypothetical protein